MSKCCGFVVQLNPQQIELMELVLIDVATTLVISYENPSLSTLFEHAQIRFAFLLVRERSALADPYCQSAWNSVGLFVCVSATLRSNISETKGDRG